jgi:very-short-patch-repair endonuclease
MFNFVYNNKYLKDTRQSLRNRLTPEEAILWNRVKNNRLGHKFRRQHGIGNFIADFYCPLKKFAIELDGSQHLDNEEYDKERTEFFESLGIKVIRFWNDDINKNLNGVLLKIEEELKG